jgi:hypothetical protein
MGWRKQGSAIAGGFTSMACVNLDPVLNSHVVS